MKLNAIALALTSVLTLAPLQAQAQLPSVVGVQVNGTGVRLASEAGPDASGLLPVIGILNADLPFRLIGVPGPLGAYKDQTAHPVAGPGLLRMTLDLDTFVPFTTGGQCNALVNGVNQAVPCGNSLGAQTRFVIDDIIITPPPGATGGVTTSINFDVDGQVFVYAINPGTRIDASISLDSFFPGFSPFGAPFAFAESTLSAEVFGFDAPARTGVTATGIFAPFASGSSFDSVVDFPISVRASTPDFVAPVGVPFLFGLTLSTGINIYNSGFSSQASPFGRAKLDFADTISLATSRPALNLPPGYTVNSVRGRIVNNQFVGGTAPPADTTAPATTATPSRIPNANGWNNTDVAVSLNAADNAGGSGVKEIQYSLTGAQGGSGVSGGSVASVPISAEGATTLTYFARDNAGNAETPKTLTLRIDKTPPTVTCASPVPTFVVGQSGAAVSATVSDGGSGPAASPVSAAADTSSAGTFSLPLLGVDIAGNQTSQSCGYVVAKAGQTIAFDPLPGRTEGDPPFTVSATASSGLPVSFSIVSGPATIAGNTITLLDSGTVIVRAAQPGNASYNPAPSVDRSFVVAIGPAGRMHGHGQLDQEGKHHRFGFFVWQARTGNEGGRLEYDVTVRGSGKGHDDDRHDRTDRFESTAVTRVTFSGSPSTAPATVVFSGVGRWNGHAVYTFEARATDGGKPGHGDTFALTIRAADGSVVAAVTGPLSDGNIVSLRVPPHRR